MPAPQAIRVLLVQDRAATADLAEALSGISTLQVTRTTGLEEGNTVLDDVGADIIVLGPDLAPDVSLKSIEVLTEAAPETPLISITDRDDECEATTSADGASQRNPRLRPATTLQLEDPPFEQRLADAIHQALRHHRETTASGKMLVNVSDTVTLLDAEARILHSTGQMTEILGRPVDFWQGRSAFELCHPDDREAAAQAFAEILTSKDTEVSAEFRGEHADGHWEYLEFTGVNLLHDPTVEAIVVTTRNVTDRKLVELELAAERDNAMARSEAKSEFVAGVVHELRSPLHVVLGLSELLKNAGLHDEAAALVGRLHVEAERLGRVLEDILDIAQIEARRLAVHSSPFSVTEIVDDVLTAYQLTAEEKGVSVTRLSDIGLHDWRQGDPGRLRQILMNLVGNAVKFTDSGQVEIEVYGSVDRHDGVAFEVTDTGIGIAAELVDSLFEPFSAASAATSHNYGGSGLGLSIARQLVELMGGDEITVSTMVGQGSKFSFTLPLPPTIQPGRSESRNAAARRPRSGLRVLVVEDNAASQQLVDRQLRAIGHHPTIVGSGDEALQLVFSEEFDAVLMDRELPGIDGFETTRRIRRRELGGDRRIPVIAMTASAMSGDRSRCLAAGMDDFCAKPVGLDALRSLLDRWLPPEPGPTNTIPLRSTTPAGSTTAVDTLVLARHADELGDVDTVMSAVRTYLNELPNRTRALTEAINRTESHEIRRLAHQLRSPSVMLGAQALADLCAAIEESADPSAVATAQDVTAAAEATEGHLRAYLGEHGYN